VKSTSIIRLAREPVDATGVKPPGKFAARRPMVWLAVAHPLHLARCV
jgi:hypothetical protein